MCLAWASREERQEEEESSASRAIRTYQQKEEKSKRKDRAVHDQPSNKRFRTPGMSRGEVTREVTICLLQEPLWQKAKGRHYGTFEILVRKVVSAPS